MSRPRIPIRKGPSCKFRRPRPRLNSPLPGDGRPRGRQGLARESAAPVSGFDFQYVLPADWLRTVAVHDNDAGLGAAAYRIEAGKILTNATEIWIRYVCQVTDANLMPKFQQTGHRV